MNGLAAPLILLSLCSFPRQSMAVPREGSIAEDALAVAQPVQLQYVLNGWDKGWIQGHGIDLQIYALIQNEKNTCQGTSPLPNRVAVVSTDANLAVQLPMEGHSDQLRWFVPNTQEPLLALEDSTGGNCFNCSFLHIISFPDWEQPVAVGRVTDVFDEDGDGWDDLMTNDDLFEIFCFCHADSPSIKIFWKVVNLELVSATEDYRIYYEHMLSDIDAAIRRFSILDPTDIPDGRGGHLWLVLQEFLIRRIITPDSAWDTLHDRLTTFDQNVFYRDGASYWISDIEFRHPRTVEPLEEPIIIGLHQLLLTVYPALCANMDETLE